MSYNMTKLNNDLRVCSTTMANTETVAVYFLVKTGSSNEVNNNPGISHFIEHMLFKGTEKYSAFDISKKIDDIGGLINAYTDKEYTCYYCVVLKEHIEIAIEILSDMIQNSVFDSNEMDRERGVVLQEIAQYNDLPDDVVFEDYCSLAFQDQILGKPILGTKDFISNLSKKDIDNYMNNNYINNNIIVSVAGACEHNQVVDLVNKHFTKKTSDEITSNNNYKYVGGNNKIIRDIEQVNITMGFQGSSYLENNYEIYKIISIILGQGMSSRLFQEIREKRGLVYSVGCTNLSYKDTGSFMIYAGTSLEQSEEFVNVTCDELIKFVKNGINNDELNRAFAQIKSSLLMSHENPSYRASSLAYSIHKFGRYREYQEILDKYYQVDDKQILETASNIFNSHLTLSYIGTVEKLDLLNIIQDKLLFQ